MLVSEDDVKLITSIDLVTLLLMRKLILPPMEKECVSGFKFIPIFLRQTAYNNSALPNGFGSG
jgi:hypothetical protein